MGTVTPPRPDHRPVPQDRAHEFLSEWLPETDAVLRRWVRHFERTGTGYTARNHGGRVMLYTHRIRATSVHGRAVPTWCCQ